MQKSNMRLLVILAAAAVAIAGLMIVLSQMGGGGSQGTLAGVPQDGTRLGSDDAMTEFDRHGARRAKRLHGIVLSREVLQ